jgi:hypothetical protein
MSKLTQSYVHGASAIPLLGDTIGVHFDKAVRRWPNAEAGPVNRSERRLPAPGLGPRSWLNQASTGSVSR